MRVILCYDVVKNQRRTKLHDKLCGFLRPVQYSVFEGDVPDRRWDDLLGVVKSTIDGREDTVRIYQICRGCLGAVTLLGTSQVIGDGSEPIIV